MNINFDYVYVTGLHDSVSFSLKNSVYPLERFKRTSVCTKIQTVLQEIKR